MLSVHCLRTRLRTSGGKLGSQVSTKLRSTGTVEVPLALPACSWWFSFAQRSVASVRRTSVPARYRTCFVCMA